MTLRSAVLVVCVALVLADREPWQDCPALQVSTIRVSLSTVQNKTGHWDTKVAFKQGEPLGGYVWLADVDQNIFQYDEQEPVLETVLYLTASPTSSPSARSHTPPWQTRAAPSNTRTPPSGYELFPGVGYYKLHPEKVDWPTARKSCAASGGHLIILNSEQEYEVAKKIIARHPTLGDWFSAGILEFGVHAEWFTLFGVPLERTGFTTIVPGENNEPGPSDFGVIHRNGGYGDSDTNMKFPFLCEFDL